MNNSMFDKIFYQNLSYLIHNLKEMNAALKKCGGSDFIPIVDKYYPITRLLDTYTIPEFLYRKYARLPFSRNKVYKVRHAAFTFVPADMFIIGKYRLAQGRLSYFASIEALPPFERLFERERRWNAKGRSLLRLIHNVCLIFAVFFFYLNAMEIYINIDHPRTEIISGLVKEHIIFFILIPLSMGDFTATNAFFWLIGWKFVFYAFYRTLEIVIIFTIHITLCYVLFQTGRVPYEANCRKRPFLGEAYTYKIPAYHNLFNKSSFVLLFYYIYRKFIYYRYYFKFMKQLFYIWPMPTPPAPAVPTVTNKGRPI